MIVDALVYAGPCLFGGGRSLAELLDEAAANGVDRLCAAPAKPADYDLVAASERLAGLGEQAAPIAGAGLWVVPNPSGLNAHETIDSLAGWYRTAAEAAGLR